MNTNVYCCELSLCCNVFIGEIFKAFAHFTLEAKNETNVTEGKIIKTVLDYDGQ